MKTQTKRSILICIVLLLMLITVSLLVVQVTKYNRAATLCDQIKVGKEIDTEFSNGATGPRFMDKLLSYVEAGLRIPLVEACYYRNVQAVKVLLENGADPNFFFEGRWSPLEAAIVKGPIDASSLEIVQLLVDRGANVNAYGSHPLAYHLSRIIIEGNDIPETEAILKLLVENGATLYYDNLYNIDSDDAKYDDRLFVFSRIIAANRFDTAKWMYETVEIDLDCVEYADRTPLIMTVYQFGKDGRDEAELKEIVLWLLENGANKLVKDAYGKTAYDYAVEYKYHEIASMLK